VRLKVLGCSGGIGGRRLRTTSFLVDGDVLLDAGSGVGDLSLGELAAVDHVFLTHCHLDHVTSIPFLVDTVGAMRRQPITVHATEETIALLRAHIFNWTIWPDFTQIPSPQAPFMRYQTVHVGETVVLAGRRFTPLPALHTVPAVGFHLDSGRASLVFTGDTGPCDALWEAVNRIEGLRFLIVETAFSNKDRELADVSRHLCPETLAEELAKLAHRDVEVWITHLKPGELELTMQEIEACVTAVRPRMLQNGQVFEF